MDMHNEYDCYIKLPLYNLWLQPIVIAVTGVVVTELLVAIVIVVVIILTVFFDTIRKLHLLGVLS